MQKIYKTFVLVALTVPLAGCAFHVVSETEPQESEDSYMSDDPAYTTTPQPGHGQCDSDYIEGLGGSLLEIPVECNPIVIDPYSDHVYDPYQEWSDPVQWQEETLEQHGR